MPKPQRARRSNSRSKEQASAYRLDHLVVMRESDRYDHILMEGMIQQTLAKVIALPGAEELARAGVEVFFNPRKWGAATRRVGRSQMAMIERDGVLYLYSMGSAATDDLPDTNAFVQELVQIVEAYAPRETWVSSFTRLTRSANYVGDLMKAFGEHPGLIHCEAEINLGTPEGKMLFQMLGMISAMERDYIVRRHTAGRVAQWRRGDWIPNAYPPGYILQGGKLLLNDDDEIISTKEMLKILANPSLGPSEAVAQLGAIGVTTPALQRLHGDQATIAEARNPTSVLNTLFGWVEAYETGQHETLWPNPFPGVTDIAGVTIEEMEGFEHGALRLIQKMPLPEEGWADPVVFDAIRAQMASTSLTGGASRSTTPPFSGLFQFANDEFEFALGTINDNYSLLCRPLNEDRKFSGWRSETEDQVDRIGVVHRVTWHRSVADAIVEAVKNGLPAELDVSRFQSSGPLPTLDPARARIRTLRHRLDDEQLSLTRARRNAQMAEDDKAAELFVSDVKHHHAEVVRLESEIEVLENGLVDPEIGQTFESNADLVAHAIAGLWSADTTGPVQLRDALRLLFQGERWEIIGENLHWELNLELPHPSGLIKFGPIKGEVPIRYSTPRRMGKRYRNNEVRQLLIEAGLSERASRSIAAADLPDLTAVLLSHLNEVDLPDGVNPEWAKHVITVYADPDFAWTPNRWRLDDSIRREVLDLMIQRGGEISVSDLIAAGIKKEQLRYLSRVTDAPSGDPILCRISRGGESSVALIDCPHCGGKAAHSIVTPETRPGILCTSCWRTPQVNSPAFPEAYRTLGALEGFVSSQSPG